MPIKMKNCNVSPQIYDQRMIKAGNDQWLGNMRIKWKNMISVGKILFYGLLIFKQIRDAKIENFCLLPTSMTTSWTPSGSQ